MCKKCFDSQETLFKLQPHGDLPDIREIPHTNDYINNNNNNIDDDDDDEDDDPDINFEVRSEKLTNFEEMDSNNAGNISNVPVDTSSLGINQKIF